MEVRGSNSRGGIKMNKEVQYEYIINNCIETCNYIGEFKTEREKIWLVLAEFLNYSRTKNLNKIRNLGEEIGEWLRGLPSCCTVDFVDYNIVQIGKKWGFCRNETQAANFVKNWWSQCGQRIVELAEINGITLNNVLPYNGELTIQEQMYD